MSSLNLLALPEEILYNILIHVDPSPRSLQNLPLVCRRFRNSVQSIPLSIRCDMVIFSDEDELEEEDQIQTFKTMSVNKGTEEFESHVTAGRIIWQVGNVNLLINAGMIVSNPRILLSLLQEYVKMAIFGDTNILRKATVDFVYLSIQGDTDSTALVKRICDFVKLVNPKAFGLVANTAVFNELKKLPITQLDLYQNETNPTQDLVTLSEMSQTLTELRLASSWRNFEYTFERAFASLNGVETLVNLTSLEIQRDCLERVSDSIMLCDLRTLKRLEKFQIRDSVSYEAFLKVTRTVPSFPPSDVEVNFDERHIFFQEIEKQPSKFEILNRVSIEDIPLTYYDISTTINRVTALLPDLNNLDIVCKHMGEPINLRNTLPPDLIMNIARRLETETNLVYVNLWTHCMQTNPEVNLMMTELEFKMSYTQALDEMLKLEGLQLKMGIF
ncbi:hypothetical protein HDU76_002628 [Blyttiomyces sp. JEL0837]|nr:hypothetical protein HDU76_002628 [Blyttiomyces sp. JEL0837]